MHRGKNSKGATKAELIDTQNDVGGWDTYNSTPEPVDTDGDGIPDEWEIANKLNPNDPADGIITNLNENKRCKE